MDDEQRAPTPQRFWRTLTQALLLVVAVAVLVWLLLPSVRSGPSWRRETCTNNMKQLVLALHNYAQRIHTNHAGTEMVSFADGFVRCLPDSISPATLSTDDRRRRDN